jgi:hypothetical protein
MMTEAKVVREAYKRFESVLEAEHSLRADALDDFKFSLGGDNQWDPGVLQERDEEERPHLTINKIAMFINQICNQQRMNRTSIIVSPVDSESDPDTAEVLQGLIRHIEYRSDAASVYDLATEFAVRCGFGYGRILTEYASEMSFDQEIRIAKIVNPFSVFMDPGSMEIDRSDASFCQIGQWYTQEDYKRLFPKSELTKTRDWEALGDTAPHWLEKERVRVIEEFHKEYKQVKIFLTENKQVLTEDQVTQFRAMGGQLASDGKGSPLWRVTHVPHIMWRKMNGVEVLEETLWPGKYIPVFSIVGKEFIVEGKRYCEGIVRGAKDPQRMINYYSTAQAEAIGNAPKAPWIVPVGGDAGLEHEFAEVNRRNLSVLHYNASDPNGKALPPPSREVIEPAIAAITHSLTLTTEDLKAAIGMFDSNLGIRDSARSGVAIRNLQQQGDMATFHFSDNLHKSITHVGRILLDLIPHIYDSERVVRIVGADEVIKQITINSQHHPPTNPVNDQTGLPNIYDLSIGQYDVTVNAGPSFQSKRQEEAAYLLECHW